MQAGPTTALERRPVLRRRLSAALGVLAAAAVLEGVGSAAALGLAERHVQQGRVASDIRTAFVELTTVKQRLILWRLQNRHGLDTPSDLQAQLHVALRQGLDSLQRLSLTAHRLDDTQAASDEHRRRREILAALRAGLAALDAQIASDRPSTGAELERPGGIDMQALIAEGLAGESVAVQRERAAADASLAWMQRLWLAMAATLAVLAVAAAVDFDRALRRPMDLLAQGTAALRQGRLQHRIPLDGDDEFSALARSFNGMAAELERHRVGEARQRQLLEARVDARTTELREALQALRQSDLRRRQLFAEVSHELRTPTTALRGEAEITLRGADRSAADYKAALRRIVDSAVQLAAVIEDLLAMARSDIDALTLIRRPVDLSGPLHAALRQAAALGAGRGIRLRLDAEPAAVVRVMGDAQRLQQLLLILLDNAVHYSADGGEVSLGLRPAAGAPPRCCIEVRDAGIGIPADELPHVFERHYRGAAARRLRPDGHGLGLAIARSLAQAHGGGIELIRRPGGGTVARLILPCAEAVEAVDTEVDTAA